MKTLRIFNSDEWKSGCYVEAVEKYTRYRKVKPILYLARMVEIQPSLKSTLVEVLTNRVARTFFLLGYLHRRELGLRFRNA